MRVSAAAETEINVQLGEMTLQRHHMQLLEESVVAHDDFVEAFGRSADGGRHQCAEVRRTTLRRWLRLLGTQHDVTIWAVDERTRPPAPRAAMLQGALSPWVQSTLDPIKASIPQLSDPNLSLTLTEVGNGHATLAVTIDGVLKELVLQRDPPALHVFNVVEHGRRWVRELIFTSNAARCYGLPTGGETSVALKPLPHWHAGDLATPAPAMASLVISRFGKDGAGGGGGGGGRGSDAERGGDGGDETSGPDYFVPVRQLNGLLPASLIEGYLFWRSHDGTAITGTRKQSSGRGKKVGGGGGGGGGGEGAMRVAGAAAAVAAVAAVAGARGAPPRA